jgi:hypothetical protein
VISGLQMPQAIHHLVETRIMSEVCQNRPMWSSTYTRSGCTSGQHRSCGWRCDVAMWRRACIQCSVIMCILSDIMRSLSWNTRGRGLVPRFLLCTAFWLDPCVVELHAYILQRLQVQCRAQPACVAWHPHGARSPLQMLAN